MCDWGGVVLIAFLAGILRCWCVSGEEWIESIEKTACLFDGLFRSIDQITINSLLGYVDEVDIWTTLERKGWWRLVEVRVEDDGNRKAEQIEHRWVLLWFSKVQFEHVHVLDDITPFDINVLLFSCPISFRESPLASDDFLGVEYVNEVSPEHRILSLLLQLYVKGFLESIQQTQTYTSIHPQNHLYHHPFMKTVVKNSGKEKSDFWRDITFDRICLFNHWFNSNRRYIDVKE